MLSIKVVFSLFQWASHADVSEEMFPMFFSDSFLKRNMLMQQTKAVLFNNPSLSADDAWLM